jgi:hypothetical protein
MARKPRVHFTGALYFVVRRGNQGQRKRTGPENGSWLLYLDDHAKRNPRTP